MSKKPEVWLRGPIEGYPLLLQPVVHAVLQAQEEIHALMRDFSLELLWERPAGMASPAFHLQHIAGVLDRMVTYAKGESLTTEQFAYLKKEGVVEKKLTTEELLNFLDLQIQAFLKFVEKTNTDKLIEFRGVGRAQLPSSVGGLLFHAAEHMTRHLGQLLVTVKILQE
ncbi:DinB family protein [Algoriphagus winogradskyi]|uniref:Uncharacterized damage-inducible protein DinB (Forms a four-helix bundle) n=1 Tax=Algoriphagus winogradskyi TaxID=237017 RepID=A0ABY1N6J7_9BACT|nr:DinB family protein [Algoriphagus winogradskyi]SMP01331.1 Uncharacterized damage-inducible protein DinB (forms a four-helix bundle) [Algoriphagus winogradskyi]